MSESPKNPPSEAIVAKAIKFIWENHQYIIGVTTSQQEANVKQLLRTNNRLDCSPRATCSIMKYLRYVADADGSTEGTRGVAKFLHKDMKGELMASEYMPELTDPFDIILNAADHVMGRCHVFGDKPTLRGAVGRFIEGGTLVETQLSTGIRDHIRTKESDGVMNDVTIIVGGPSGGGKTVSLMDQSQKFNDGRPQVVVAYIIGPPKHLSNLTAEEIQESQQSQTQNKGDTPKNAPGLEACETKPRNERVCNWLVDELFAAIPEEVIEQMTKITSDRPLQLLIVVDEIGGEGFNCLVRALCAIKPSQVHKLFVERLLVKHKTFAKHSNCMSNVTFRLAAAGTGIGVSEKGMVGSCADDYKLFWAYDGSPTLHTEFRKSNRNIFKAYFLGVKANTGICTLHKTLIHRLFWNMISENARMAAILGSQLNDKLVIFEPEANHTDVLHMLDLTQFLGNAIFKFRGLNGLKDLKHNQLWETLLKAVRMHWFPNALTRGMDAMQTARGMIVDRSVWVNISGNELSPGESSKMMPSFSVSLLGMLCGNPVITQSIISGASLEEYNLTLFFLLACAACDSDMFLAALDKGQLMPLTRKVPPTKDLPLQSVVHDLQRDTDKKDFVEAVTAAIGHFTKTVTTASGTYSLHHVAAFRGFDKEQFADNVLFLNGSIFVCQDNDFENGYSGEELRKEQSKMGSEVLACTQAKTHDYMKSFVTQLRSIIDAPLNTLISESDSDVNDKFVVHVLDLLRAAQPLPRKAMETASNRMDTLIKGLRKLFPTVEVPSPSTDPHNGATVTPSTQSNDLIKKVMKLVETTDDNRKAKLALPRKWIKGLCLAWYERTGKKVMDIYRCIVTPVEVNIGKGEGGIHYEPLDDEEIKISGETPADDWTATLHGRDRFVSVEHVKFLTFDPKRTRTPPYAASKLPCIRLAKEGPKTPQLLDAESVQNANNYNAEEVEPRNKKCRAERRT